MSKQDTAIALRRMANLVKGVIQAADDIEAIGSLENSTREATEARDKAQAERDAALAELTDAKAKGKTAVNAAREKADKLMADASDLIERVTAEKMAEADATAKANLDMASRQAAEMVSKATAAAQKWEQAVADLTAQATSLGAEVIDLESKRATAQAEHDKLTKALDKIKSQFKIE